MAHPTKLTLEVSLEELGARLAGLRYDTLSTVLRVLSTKLLDDSKKDLGRGRPKLAKALFTSGTELQTVFLSLDEAWGICQKFEST